MKDGKVKKSDVLLCTLVAVAFMLVGIGLLASVIMDKTEYVPVLAKVTEVKTTRTGRSMFRHVYGDFVFQNREYRHVELYKKAKKGEWVQVEIDPANPSHVKHNAKKIWWGIMYVLVGAGMVALMLLGTWAEKQNEKTSKKILE